MESTRILNGVPTRCLTFDTPPSHHQHPSSSSSVAAAAVTATSEYLILVVPGNPGVIEFYREFMSETFALIRQRFPSKSIPVMGISHCGHVNISNMQFPDSDEHRHLYDLKGQIAAKVAFLDTLPKDVKIIAIGHSIGCKMLMETIKSVSPQVQSRVLKCYMLFPTIERMRETPNGRRLSPLLPYYKIFYYLLLPIMLLPQAIQKWLLSLYFFMRMPPECIITAALELFHGHVNRRMNDLTIAEFEEVVDLDVETLTLHQEKLFFYFGTTDEWCPLDYVHGMRARVPTMRHQICERGMKHAFVVESSREMASFLSPLIAQDIEQFSSS